MMFRRFRVTTSQGGSLEISISDRELPIGFDWNDSWAVRGVLGHKAWCALWDTDAKKMLKDLCDKIGVDKVKVAFIEKIQFEEIE